MLSWSAFPQILFLLLFVLYVVLNPNLLNPYFLLNPNLSSLNPAF